MWYVDSTVAGFARSGGGLTQLVIVNAGHQAPMDQPGACLYGASAIDFLGGGLRKVVAVPRLTFGLMVLIALPHPHRTSRTPNASRDMLQRFVSGQGFGGGDARPRRGKHGPFAGKGNVKPL